MEIDSSPLLAVVSALGAGSVGIAITKWFERRKTDADVAATVQTTYSSLLDDLRTQLQMEREAMKISLAEAEKKCQDEIRDVEHRLHQRIHELEEEVQRLRSAA